MYMFIWLLKVTESLLVPVSVYSGMQKECGTKKHQGHRFYSRTDDIKLVRNIQDSALIRDHELCRKI